MLGADQTDWIPATTIVSPSQTWLTLPVMIRACARTADGIATEKVGPPEQNSGKAHAQNFHHGFSAGVVRTIVSQSW